MGKWFHTIGSVGVVAITILSPVLQGVIASHPEAAAVLAGVYALVGQFLPHQSASPQKSI